MKTIPVLQSEGLLAVSSGDYDTAITAFRLALNQVRWRAEALATPPPETFSQRTVRLTPVKSLLTSSDSSLCTTAFAVTVLEDAHSTHNLAMVLTSEIDANLLGVAVLYNMGLCFQRKSHDAITHKSTLLRKARTCYVIALRMAESLEVSEDTMTTASLLLLALANNLACLHSDRYDHASIQWCVEWVDSRLEAAGDEHAFFWMNAMTWKLARTSPAAAA